LLKRESERGVRDGKKTFLERKRAYYTITNGASKLTVTV